ncbi:hypothetical protein D9V28_07575 [Mycetocola zhadangensis]|uniref:Uncharacterized protein n=2 Tax=Mycetocola zhadangensis TaxID=1164595 RepID=A0A3L7J0X2_9MICO|nr:hypothetical protein D9V28_07575 [Mycetocola zhadangensis]
MAAAVVNPSAARIGSAYARPMTNHEETPQDSNPRSDDAAPTSDTDTSDDAGFGADEGIGDGTGLGEGNGNAGQSSEDSPAE